MSMSDPIELKLRVELYSLQNEFRPGAIIFCGRSLFFINEDRKK